MKLNISIKLFVFFSKKKVVKYLYILYTVITFNGNNGNNNKRSIK